MRPEYAAGLLDGEGCVSVQRYVYDSGQIQHTLQISIIMRERDAARLLSEMKDVWGGTIRRRPANGTTAAQTHWRLMSSEEIHRFLKAVRPHLRIKGQQVDLAMEYLETVGPHRLSGSAITERDRIYAKMRDLNRKGRLDGPVELPDGLYDDDTPTDQLNLRLDAESA